ncbi:hypothetical protein Q8791_28980 [Nocardiopsis sp. CT-R113]|uniref:Uncharacterized protein n=1 Tax=Nocardiopsis codii TaxID=3065942 RepID=A0ABU7KG98_9ACTN|nr:hypothetical protein [Nocardiopsis sp. CT-R113]MEE2041266.1 hypothetical protein [Nocardiopsis sp. CT-R113]
MPTPTADAAEAPTFEQALAAAAECLRTASRPDVTVGEAECHTHIADRWLNLAALLKP